MAELQQQQQSRYELTPDFIMWVAEVGKDVGHEMEINFDNAWRYYNLGYTPLQYYFEVWLPLSVDTFGNFPVSKYDVNECYPEPEIVEYVHEDSRVLWGLIQYYWQRCSRLSFKETITEIQ